MSYSMKVKFTTEPGARPDRISTLYGYFQALGAGRNPTPAADWYPGLSREEVATLSLTVTDQALRNRPILKAYEHSRLSKYGPQGGIPPMDDPLVVETISRYYRDAQPCKPDPKTYRELKRWFSTAELVPYSYAEVIARQHEKGTLDTSSGLPFLTKRENVIYDAMQEAAAGRHYPAIMGFRSIRNGIRNIYMYPMVDNLEELSYVYPVMDWLISNSNCVAAWKGKRRVVDAIQREFPKETVTHVSGDYDKMDTTVQAPQVAVGADLITAMFQPKYRDRCRASLKALNTKRAVLTALQKQGTPVTATSPGSPRAYEFVLSDQDHGLYSGSGWTNCLETILNILANLTVAGGEPLAGMQANGDDSTLTMYGYHPHLAERWVKVVTQLGFSANVEKQLQSYTELHYLQLVFEDTETRNGGVVQGSYPALLAANSAKNPERWQSIPHEIATDRERAMEAIRLMAIGNNCVGNPAFPQIVKMFVQGSPSHCGLELPSEAWRLPEKAFSKAYDFMWQHDLLSEETMDKISITYEDGTHVYDVGDALIDTPFMQVAVRLLQEGEI